MTWYQHWQSRFEPTPTVRTTNLNYDWPNPIPYPRLPDYTWIQEALTLIPFPNVLTQTLRTQVTSPNPQPISWYQNWTQSGNSLTAVVFNPSIQSDWPLPRTYQPIDQFWSKGIQQAIPFNQLDWPNPKISSWYQSWTNVGNVQLPFPTPFFQNVDFPLPVISQPIDPTWIGNLSEFLQSETFPFHQSDYPNPYPVYWYRDYNQNLVIYLPVGIKPFNQNDWPLPETYNPIDQYWYQALVLNLPEPIPPPPITSSGKTWTNEEWTKKLTQYVRDRQPKLLTFSEMGKMGGRPRK